jgi:hypothetical protein
LKNIKNMRRTVVSLYKAENSIIKKNLNVRLFKNLSYYTKYYTLHNTKYTLYKWLAIAFAKSLVPACLFCLVPVCLRLVSGLYALYGF